MFLEILGSIFGGGATGILGVIAQRYFDYKNRKLDIEFEKEKRNTAIAIAEANMKSVKQEWEGRKGTEREKQEGEAFTKSVWEGPQRYSPKDNLTAAQKWMLIFLDALRGSVQPLLTIYLCALTTYVWIQVKSLIGAEDLDLVAALEVWKMVVQTILYLTTTVTLWWFGTRNRSKAPEIGNGK